MKRDALQEIDKLAVRMSELERLVRRCLEEQPSKAIPAPGTASGRISGGLVGSATDTGESGEGTVYYSGHYEGRGRAFHWTPQERRMDELLRLNTDKASKVLSALGHKQRLDILRAVVNEPLSGAALVERLNMGTTGQLYHHLKALLGADLLVQEPGGGYTLPVHRMLPLLLLLAALTDLIDTSDYMDMTEVRSNAGAYLGREQGGYDTHILLWAVLENSVLEHRAGYCSEVDIFVHDDYTVTVADNGRGIPVRLLPSSNLSNVQSVLTDIAESSGNAPFVSPGAEKGISIAVVNALSESLSVEIKREGKVHRQDYMQGIPQTELLTVGLTEATGTSVTFRPNRELFGAGFERKRIEEGASELAAAYPGLAVMVHGPAQ
ncbi:ArsR family transcriptional regulator [Paenibacillus elgii]|uniref:DNA topoisomerase (ATP-hydrolyzing) n=1 Tax=Paenibacillus elgii TaxID=189691 RepID=A0A2T6G5I4_9BACL|nr:ATP-binding protein [Paenibacillus elgii]PUA39382.1 ArsR family transcriptional regulator [Paenibacillus elgii]